MEDSTLALSFTNNVLFETWELDDDEAVGGQGPGRDKQGLFLPFLFCDCDPCPLGLMTLASVTEIRRAAPSSANTDNYSDQE